MPLPNLRALAALRTGGRLARHGNGGLDALRLPASLSSDGRGALRSRAPQLDSLVPKVWLTDETAGTVSRGGQHPPGAGSTDGHAIRSAGSALPDCGFGFEQDIAAAGYAWWYVDGVSDDGQYALTIIGFQGSVFSPYYAWSDGSKPLDHCAINVALYGPRLHKWAMTERDAGAVERTRTTFSVGPSGMSWDGQTLTIELDEITPPFPLPMMSQPIKGRVRVHPKVFTARAFELDAAARHVWWPIAPMARIEVELDEPSVTWSGHGYIDSNRGSEPLEDGFSQWDWSRAPLGQDAVVVYDVESRHAPIEPLAIRFDRMGECEPMNLPQSVTLSRTRWLVPRTTRADAGAGARVIKTLEDSPFYARSLVEATVAGKSVPTIHESLSLDRFASPIVKWMLPYKMPRVTTR